jgi:hypothetical protein
VTPRKHAQPPIGAPPRHLVVPIWRMQNGQFLEHGHWRRMGVAFSTRRPCLWWQETAAREVSFCFAGRPASRPDPAFQSPAGQVGQPADP